MKTARFAQVVSKSGRPEVHDQWVAPEKDATLKKALREKRVMTVHIQTVGTKKDYGEAGLVKAGQRVLLVFPKSLHSFEGRRVVGIDYSLLKEPPQRPKKPKKEPPEKPEKTAGKRRDPQGRPSEEVLHLFQRDQGKHEEQGGKEGPTAADREPRKPARTARKTPRPVKRKSARPSKAVARSNEAAPEARLRTLIKKAMKQLRGGKAVQAYQILETALE